MHILPMTAEDFQVKVQLPSEDITIDIRKDLRINDASLTQEWMEQASMFAFYSTLLADQKHKLAGLERDLTRYYCELSLSIRQGKVKVIEKLTEGAIKDYIEGDNRYGSMKDEIHAKEGIIAKLSALVSGSMQRKDMLTQLGLQERQERRNNSNT